MLSHQEQFKLLFENCSDAVLVFDSQKNILEANRNAVKLFKLSLDKLLQTKAEDILPQQIWGDLGKQDDCLDNKFNSQITDKKDKIVPVAVRVKSLTQDNQTLHYAFLQNLHERQRLLNELDGRCKELACLFSISKAKEEKGTLEEIFADIADHVVVGLQAPEDASAIITYRGQSYKSQKFEESSNVISEKFIVKEGDEGEIKLFYSPNRSFCLNEKNLLAAVAQSLARIIKRKEIEERVVRERENLVNVIQEVGIGISIIDKDYKIVWANEISEKAFGGLDTTKGTYCYQTYHKQSNICSGCPLQKTFAKGTVEMETKCVKIPGKELYFQLTTAPIFDKNNQVIQGLTLCQDVTKLRKMEMKLKKYNEDLEAMVAKRNEQLFESEEKYRTFMENSSDLMGIINADSAFIYVNEAFLRTLGYKKSDMINLSIHDIIEPDEVYSFDSRQIKSLKKYGKIDQIRLKLSSNSGRKIVGELNATAIIDSAGKYKGARIIIRDITGRIQAEEEIKKLIITDNLTGLYNQRHFYDQLAKEVERAKRTGRPLSLLLFDIDNFKSYNDSFGHLDGDRVLAKMGKIITCHIRNIDMGFRYGGEEFTVILPDSDIDQAIRVAKRLREAFSGCLFMPESKSDDMMVVYKTISIGVAQYRLGDNFKALVKNADDAMYIAKRAGGDRIHIFQAYHS